MAGFAGSYDHNLDSKGRVIVPVAFRKGLGKNITIGLNGTATALALYPEEEWQRFEDQLSRISPTDKIGNSYKTFVTGNAFTENEPDAQGRILLPARLRAKVNLGRELIFLGATQIVEIWDAAAYQQAESNTQMNFTDVLLHVKENYHF